MKWDQEGDHSRNVEDRRGQAPAGGGGGGLRLPGGKLSLGGIVILILAAVARNFMGGGDGGGGASVNAGSGPSSGGAVGDQGGAPPAPGEDADLELKKFSSALFDDIQDFWIADLKKHGGRYQEAKLVLFSEAVESGCGIAGSEVGPFYCPPDTRVYIDLSFFRELHQRFGAPGDFARAYVIAHEVGHHVQNLLGDSAKVEEASRRNKNVANQLSVRLELQADCYAGVWASSAARRNLLEAGDVEEGLGAATAVGDDRLQKQATGHVNPETWTHGSSAQRVKWFKVGLASGDLTTCDTFSKEDL
jgi:predicted metalloprotease